MQWKVYKYIMIIVISYNWLIIIKTTYNICQNKRIHWKEKKQWINPIPYFIGPMILEQN